jgi:hypothetical protein
MRVKLKSAGNMLCSKCAVLWRRSPSTQAITGKGKTSSERGRPGQPAGVPRLREGTCFEGHGDRVAGVARVVAVQLQHALQQLHDRLVRACPQQRRQQVQPCFNTARFGAPRICSHAVWGVHTCQGPTLVCRCSACRRSNRQRKPSLETILRQVASTLRDSAVFNA